MKENTIVTPFEFDTRMIEWNLKHDVITKDAVEKYLKTLTDESANSESLHIEDEGGSQQE